jgi:hypothetical protein
MTGTFLRVRREDKWENVEIEYLTSDEIESLFLDREPKELVNWLTHLIAQLRPIAEHIDAMIKEDVDVNR